IDTKVIVFIDYFYPLTDETYIKFSFLNYKPQFLSSSLTATSAFTLNNFVSPYTSMNNYISSFFNQPSGSNVLGFSGVNIWTNSFLNDFVKSMEDTDPYLGKAGFLFFTE
ncbi:hypothetical protein EBQ81_00275, partial [bacterium]|nr:hypothetical protein [bacterium]